MPHMEYMPTTMAHIDPFSTTPCLYVSPICRVVRYVHLEPNGVRFVARKPGFLVGVKRL